MTKRRTFLKAAVAAGSLALAGFTATAPAMADELDTLKDAGVMRIAMSGAYPPFNFVNDKNEVVGFDPAIGAEIAKRMGLEVEIITTAWDGIIGACWPTSTTPSSARCRSPTNARKSSTLSAPTTT